MAKAERLGEYFSSVFTSDNGVLPQTSRTVDEETELSEVEFKPDLVYKHSRKLNDNTSCGPDLIPGLLLKNLLVSFTV